MQGFEYPTEPHTRRHGPEGYRDYASYRDWLRDEFTFRCVYCLTREQWYNRAAAFNIEHFIPVTVNPLGKCEYTNLLYACATCNNAKRDILGVPDPCHVAFADCVRVRSDGRIESLNDNDDGKALVEKLCLNSDKNLRFRSRWMRMLQAFAATHPGLYEELMGFPDELPDLRVKRVPRNTKPDGAKNCYFAQRERGDLPATY